MRHASCRLILLLGGFVVFFICFFTVHNVITVRRRQTTCSAASASANASACVASKLCQPSFQTYQPTNMASQRNHLKRDMPAQRNRTCTTFSFPQLLTSKPVCFQHCIPDFTAQYDSTSDPCLACFTCKAGPCLQTSPVQVISSSLVHRLAGPQETQLVGKNTCTVPMPHVCSLMDRCCTVPRSTAGQQAQQCVGLQPHLHD